MSRSDEEDGEGAATPETQASPEPEKGRINDPLTRDDVEAPRMAWQGERPSPEADGGDGGEGPEAGR